MRSIGRRGLLTFGAGTALTAAGVAGARPADAATRWQRLVVVTANVGRNRAHPGTRRTAIKDVRHAVDGAFPLVGWQEIDEGPENDREIEWINRWFGARYRNIFEQRNHTHRVPMSIPRTYRILQRTHTNVHGGKAGVSPHRIITEALLARRDDPDVRFAFVNTHYVAGAWNGEHDPHEGWRDRMWAKHRETHVRVLEKWRARGVPVIWTGDVNKQRLGLLLPRHEKRAFPDGGIDQIGWIPGPSGSQTEIRLNGTRTVGMNVDSHDARVAIFHLRRRP